MSVTREPAELAADRPPVPWSEGQPPELQSHYVARLGRLIELRRDHLGELNQEGIWLLDRTIFATYCDCVEVGAGLAAQELLRSLPSPEETAGQTLRSSRHPRRS